MALRRHRHRLRRDHQLDRSAYGPGYCIVKIAITAFFLKKSYCVGTDICSFSCIVSFIAEVLGNKSASCCNCSCNSACIALLVTVVDLAGAVAVDRDRKRRRSDLQLAGSECLRRIIAGDINTCCIYDCICRCKRAFVISCLNVGPFCGSIGYSKDISVAETYYIIIICINGLAGSGHRTFGKRTSILFLTVIDFLDILYSYRQLRCADGQRAEILGDRIVAGFGSAPDNVVGVAAAADFGLAAGHFEGDGVAGSECHGSGRGRRSRSPCPSYIGSPVTVIECGSFGLRKGCSVIMVLAGRRRADR